MLDWRRGIRRGRGLGLQGDRGGGLRLDLPGCWVPAGYAGMVEGALRLRGARGGSELLRLWGARKTGVDAGMGDGDGGGRRGLEDLVVEVAPGGVGLFDEAEFPGAMPALRRLSRKYALSMVGWGSYQTRRWTPCFRVKPGTMSALCCQMRPGRSEVAADVEGAVAFAGEDVDAGDCGIGRGHGLMVGGGRLRVREVWDGLRIGESASFG